MAVAITLTALLQDSGNVWFLLIVLGAVAPIAAVIAWVQEHGVDSDDPHDDPDSPDDDSDDVEPRAAAGPQVEVPEVRLPAPRGQLTARSPSHTRTALPQTYH